MSDNYTMEQERNWCRDHPQQAADNIDRLRSEVTRLHAALAEAREVIGPFAEAASFFEQRYLNTDVVADGERQGESYRIEIGHLRRARAFLGRYVFGHSPSTDR